MLILATYSIKQRRSIMRQANPEIEAMHRILHLLEENSIGHLATQRNVFEKAVQDIYVTVENKIRVLERAN